MTWRVIITQLRKDILHPDHFLTDGWDLAIQSVTGFSTASSKRGSYNASFSHFHAYQKENKLRSTYKNKCISNQWQLVR